MSKTELENIVHLTKQQHSRRTIERTRGMYVCFEALLLAATNLPLLEGIEVHVYLVNGHRDGRSRFLGNNEWDDEGWRASKQTSCYSASAFDDCFVLLLFHGYFISGSIFQSSQRTRRRQHDSSNMGV